MERFDVAAYRAAVRADFTVSEELTAARLLEIAEKSEARYQELLAQYPPGTVNDERNRMRERREAALVCAEWLERKGLPSATHVGPFGPELPARGQSVTVKKGSTVFGTGSDIGREGRVSARAQVVKVHSVNRGYIDMSGTSRPTWEQVRNAEVHWAGAHGYWRWTDANNIVVAIGAETHDQAKQ